MIRSTCPTNGCQCLIPYVLKEKGSCRQLCWLRTMSTAAFCFITAWNPNKFSRVQTFLSTLTCEKASAFPCQPPCKEGKESLGKLVPEFLPAQNDFRMVGWTPKQSILSPLLKLFYHSRDTSQSFLILPTTFNTNNVTVTLLNFSSQSHWQRNLYNDLFQPVPTSPDPLSRLPQAPRVTSQTLPPPPAGFPEEMGTQRCCWVCGGCHPWSHWQVGLPQAASHLDTG